MEIVRCNEGDYEKLAGIWERSVMATHSLLKRDDFNEIKAALIPGDISPTCASVLTEVHPYRCTSAVYDYL